MSALPAAPSTLRVLPAGDAVLVELADLSSTLGLLASLQAAPIAGVREIVPGARTLLIAFDPLVLCRQSLAAELARRPLDLRCADSGPRVDIPVYYDGEDLADAAAFLKIPVEEVVRRHTGSDWYVAFTGFAPGFAYLTGGDELLRQLPRRTTPRTRIPPGAVAVAGGFSGVYPKASPGGWQLLGQTPTPMWDLDRDPPALLQPGQRVRFVDAGPRPVVSLPAAASEAGPACAPASEAGRADPGGRDTSHAPAVVVRAAGLQSLLQDLGRPGRAGQGVAAAGAMDRAALRTANRLVGNAAGEAGIETVLGGFELESVGDTVVAVTGAQGPLTLRAPDGRTWAVERQAPLALSDGDRLSVGAPHAGVRSYIALRGGIAREPVLGSLSYDSLADVGPAPLRPGERIGLKTVRGAAAVGAPELGHAALPSPGDTLTLDIQLGPRSDWFSAQALELLTSQAWTVTPQSNRVGLRVQGAQPLTRVVGGELPSEGTSRGSIQVPASGQPVLFLADHPLTGGYPVVACIAPWHLDLAGQMPVGVHLRFKIVAGFDPIVVPR